MIELQQLGKTFYTRNGPVEAVREISLKICDGDIFGIIGLSGAGKSTLVRCINFLERPTEGRVLFDGTDLGTLSAKQLREKRRQMSMIFQGFNLLAQRTVLRNVCFPLEIAGVSRREAAEKARGLLEMVGLSDKEQAYPGQLSGGQKQRVAIARALAPDPKVLLCDEATSALDPTTTHAILELLQNINRKLGVTIIVITHEMRVVEQICNRVAVLDNSRVVEEGAVKDIFLAPRSKMAKALIMPENAAVRSISGSKTIRIVFDGNSAFEPVISNLSLECRAAVNILMADTKNIEGRAYGQMLLQLPEDEAAAERIRDYLKRIRITFEEGEL